MRIKMILNKMTLAIAMLLCFVFGYLLAGPGGSFDYPTEAHAYSTICTPAAFRTSVCRTVGGEGGVNIHIITFYGADGVDIISSDLNTNENSVMIRYTR